MILKLKDIKNDKTRSLFFFWNTLWYELRKNQHNIIPRYIDLIESLEDDEETIKKKMDICLRTRKCGIPAFVEDYDEFKEITKIKVENKSHYTDLEQWLDRVKVQWDSDVIKHVLTHSSPLLVIRNESKNVLEKVKSKFLELLEGKNFYNNIFCYTGIDFEMLCKKTYNEDYANIQFEMFGASYVVFDHLYKVGDHTNTALIKRLEKNRICIITIDDVDSLGEYLKNKIQESLIL